MKNFILFLIVCATISCSSDDNSAVVDDNTVVVSEFDMTVNGIQEPVYDAYKRVESVDNGNAVKTTLKVEISGQSCGGNCYAKSYAEIQITSPSEESIFSTHIFTDNPNSNVSGSFNGYSLPTYRFKSGSFTLSKLGGDHYKIVFNDVKGEFQAPTYVLTVLIDGYFDGNFENY